MSANSQPMFASLSLYNYRVFFLGTLVSNIGGWMAIIAQDWLVLTELTDHSSSALGIVSALQFLPVAVLAPFAGALADRIDKRTLLIVTQTIAGLTALTLYALVATGVAHLWHLFVLASVTGMTMAFDNPARQAFVSEIVPIDLLPNAIGLNSASFNGARLIGPGLGGLLIGAFGVAPAMLINSITYLAVIGALVVMHTDELTPAAPTSRKRAVRDGIAYVRSRPDILLVLFVVFMLGTFGMNFQITNALMATKVFHRGAEEFGLLGSVMAIGSLAAALLAARRKQPRWRVLLSSLGLFTGFMVMLALAPTYEIYALLLVPVGMSALTCITSANSMVQLAAGPEFRGRVMALYLAIFIGGTPIGAPLIGWIGDLWGARWTLLIGAIATGIATVFVSGYLFVYDRVRVGLEAAWPPRLVVEHRDE